MLTSFAQGVKKYFHYSKEFLLLSGILVILVMTFFSTVVMADEGRPENAIGYYTQDGKVTWLIADDDKIGMDLRGLTPSEMEILFPMSSENEAAIIHKELPCTVIVDGVRFGGDQISIFNGKRLYYVIGTDEELYAFTTAKGLEEYQSDHPAQASPKISGEINYFFEDNGYSGDSMALLVGGYISNLSLVGFDEIISSVQISVTAERAYLYDQNYFQGNCLTIPGGQNVPQLATYGWNDRALSVKTE